MMRIAARSGHEDHHAGTGSLPEDRRLKRTVAPTIAYLAARRGFGSALHQVANRCRVGSLRVGESEHTSHRFLSVPAFGEDSGNLAV